MSSSKLTSGEKPKSATKKKHYYDRRAETDRRQSTPRRKDKDRRIGWGKIDEHLLEGALTAAATIVHQFSRPFTIIIGYVDLILSSTNEEETRKKLKIVRDQLSLIVKILHNFRELQEYETKDFDGMTLLDVDSEDKNENEL